MGDCLKLVVLKHKNRFNLVRFGWNHPKSRLNHLESGRNCPNSGLNPGSRLGRFLQLQVGRERVCGDEAWLLSFEFGVLDSAFDLAA